MKLISKYILTAFVPVLLYCAGLAGCKKFVEVPDPISQVPGDEVFASDANAATAIRGMYYKMNSSPNTGMGGGIQAALGVSADGLYTRLPSNQFNEFSINAVSTENNANQNQWKYFYNNIYNANIIIEHITASTGMSESAKKLGTAEAKFIRAVNFFYLVNMYGDVPMPVTSNYEENRLLKRTPVAVVYDLIKEDLLYAQANLGAEYQGAARIRVNRYAATAMLAKVYLYLQDWANAETQATEVIGNTSLYSLETNLGNTFLFTSREAILRFHQPGTNSYCWDGYVFVPSSSASSAPNYLVTDTFLNTFETGDLRKTNWINTKTIGAAKYTYPYKYKANSGTGTPLESHIFLRLSEMFLIRAEARAQQDQLNTAIADLDKVRQRAGITLINDTNPGITKEDLLAVIAHERWVELFEENGDRWLDLKRTGKADEVLQDKPDWDATRKLFPIPKDDMDYNPLLIQNPGY